MKDEIFREVELPSSYNECKLVIDRMSVIGGCLCLVSSYKKQVDVWMMTEFGVRESWSKFRVADPGFDVPHLLCLSEQDEIVLGEDSSRIPLAGMSGRVRIVDEFDEEKLLLDEFDEERLLLYSLAKGTRRAIAILGIPTRDIVWGENCDQTLVSPNHGAPIRRQFEASTGESCPVLPGSTIDKMKGETNMHITASPRASSLSSATYKPSIFYLE